MKVFAPDRAKKDPARRWVGSIWGVAPLGTSGRRVQGSEVVNYDKRLLFRLLGPNLTMRTIVEKKGGVKEKLSSSKMIEELGTLVHAPAAFSGQDLFHNGFIHQFQIWGEDIAVNVMTDDRDIWTDIAVKQVVSVIFIPDYTVWRELQGPVHATLPQGAYNIILAGGNWQRDAGRKVSFKEGFGNLTDWIAWNGVYGKAPVKREGNASFLVLGHRGVLGGWNWKWPPAVGFSLERGVKNLKTRGQTLTGCCPNPISTAKSFLPKVGL